MNIKTRIGIHLIGILAALATTSARPGEVTGLTTFSAGTPARAAEVNGNFNAVKAAVDDNHNRINTHDAAITGLEARFQDVCATGFVRVGLWCLDADGTAETAFAASSANQNGSGSAATNVDAFLGLSVGTVRAVRVRTVVREALPASTATSVFACVGSQPLTVSDLLRCAGAAVNTGLIAGVQEVPLQVEHVIPVDQDGNVHTLCAWGTGGPDQGTCWWYVAGYQG